MVSTSDLAMTQGQVSGVCVWGGDVHEMCVYDSTLLYVCVCVHVRVCLHEMHVCMTLQ